MRKFSSHLVYRVSAPPLPFGIVETDDDGTLLRIRDTGGVPTEEAGLEFYPGILIPGMVNAHCHLELSHLYGRVPERTGIAGFVSDISRTREALPGEVLRSARLADLDMYRLGISGCGDIGNTAVTAAIKAESPIRYHTFLEVFSLDRDAAATRIREAIDRAERFREAGLPCTLSPHAPYSLSENLWENLSGHPEWTERISIHHDESPEEREFLQSGSGPMADSFRKAGMDLTSLPSEAGDTLRLLARFLPESRYLLVHNTMTHPDRLQGGTSGNLFPVLCPRSNRYIENRLPDIRGFVRSGLPVCLGTDSLASNHDLSVLEEIKAVLDDCPEAGFETVLRWATLNGARALGFDDTLGSLEVGKKPGLVNLSLFDWEQKRPAGNSRPVRLI